MTGCFQTHLTHDLRGLSDEQLQVSWSPLFLIFLIPLIAPRPSTTVSCHLFHPQTSNHSLSHFASPHTSLKHARTSPSMIGFLSPSDRNTKNKRLTIGNRDVAKVLRESPRLPSGRNSIKPIHRPIFTYPT